MVPIGFKHFAWEYMNIRGSAIYIVNFCSDLVFLLGVLGLIVGGSSRAAESIVALPRVSPQGLDANLIRIIFRVLGIVAAVIVFLEGGRHLGFPITTLIASAGTLRQRLGVPLSGDERAVLDDAIERLTAAAGGEAAKAAWTAGESRPVAEVVRLALAF